MKIKINNDGSISHLYNETLLNILNEDNIKSTVSKRASNVEPENDGTWSVDLTKSNGIKHYGFKNRSTAIKFEIDWLDKFVIK